MQLTRGTSTIVQVLSNGANLSAHGSYNALANGPHAQASVTIVERAQLTVTDELARSLLHSNLEIDLRPDIGQVFKVIAEPGEIAPALGIPADHWPYFPDRDGCPDFPAALIAGLHRTGAVLLRSRAGMGKTREISQLATTLCVRGWTVYLCESHRIRMALPNRLAPGGTPKALLLIDDLHQALPGGEFPNPGAWLGALDELFARHFAPADLRIVIATRSEPRHYDRLGFMPQDTAWHRFTVFDLPEFAPPDLVRVLAWAIEHFGIESTPEEMAAMVSESDGSPATLLERVRSTTLRGVSLNLTTWRTMRSEDWSERYPIVVAGHPDTRAVLSAVVLLQSVRIPVTEEDTVRLARRWAAAEPESALRHLIDNRILASSASGLRLFDPGQAIDGLAQAGYPVPSLSAAWPQMAAALEARTDGTGGQALLALAAECARAGEIAAAIDLATRAEASPAARAEAQLARSRFRLASGDFEGARADSQAALALDATLLGARFWLGMAQFSAGDLSAAESSFTAAMASTATASGLLARSLARIRLGKPAEAEDDLNAALRERPSDAQILLVRGCLRLARADSLAVQDFDAILTGGRHDDGLVYLLRGIARRATDLSGADSDLTRALELGQSDPNIYVTRGAVRAASGNQAGAEQDFTSAITLGIPGDELLYSRGIARMLQRKWPDAEADFTLALESAPGIAGIYAMRAAARLNQNHATGAVADLTLAMEHGPATVELLRARSIARWKAGDSKGALQDKEAAAGLRQYP